MTDILKKPYLDSFGLFNPRCFVAGCNNFAPFGFNCFSRVHPDGWCFCAEHKHLHTLIPANQPAEPLPDYRGQQLRKNPKQERLL